MKDATISIRMDSQLKEQAEDVLAQFGLNMATVVNMLFHQIVREREIPLSLSLNRRAGDELRLAKADRLAGYTGRMAENVADEMERILAETEHGAEKI